MATKKSATPKKKKALTHTDVLAMMLEDITAGRVRSIIAVGIRSDGGASIYRILLRSDVSLLCEVGAVAVLLEALTGSYKKPD